MGAQVVATAQLACTFGTTPSALSVLPTPSLVQAGGQPAATIQDTAPMANIASFGMCSAPTNPQVIAATSAASGVFTPQPCIPSTGSPWMPGAAMVLINGKPALNSTSTCMCMWGGAISVSSPGQGTVQTA